MGEIALAAEGIVSGMAQIGENLEVCANGTRRVDEICPAAHNFSRLFQQESVAD